MLLAIFGCDAIALPLSPTFPTGELQYILDNSEAKVLLATEKYANKAQDILQAGLQHDPLFDIRQKFVVGGSGSETVSLMDSSNSLERPAGGMMLYTSGTTARPVCDCLHEYIQSEHTC
jgi:acyl-coenzyme A synthetase/AMP-(fatty) acid ligase